MSFNSPAFLVFFPVVTLLYFLFPHRLRWALLLAASCIFYMAFVPWYILILALTITVDYLAGLLLEKTEGKTRRRLLLIASLAANLGILFVFKYYAFATGAAGSALGWLGIRNPFPRMDLILPIGLSFHTFQALSYTIEVYRGRQRAEKNFGIFALYVMFYPQLVAGPIERPQHLLPQFHENHTFNEAQFLEGLHWMAWGFFKKIVIADRLAEYVDLIYSSPADHHGLPVILANYFFSAQIYCDFSGYSDIAIGAALVMGFQLMKNFDRPYCATSIPEFWRRWHMSLMSWFRDYLYIPLGGNRKGTARTVLNLLIVFALSGLWHGARWTFVLWGLYHGALVILSFLKKRLFPSRGEGPMRKALGIFLTFQLVSISWFLFRAESFSQALSLASRALRFDAGWWKIAVLGGYGTCVCLFVFVLLFVCEYAGARQGAAVTFRRLPFPLRYAGYVMALFLFLQFGYFHEAKEFIYFQF